MKVHLWAPLTNLGCQTCLTPLEMLPDIHYGYPPTVRYQHSYHPSCRHSQKVYVVKLPIVEALEEE